MSKYYYKREEDKLKKWFRRSSLLIFLIGLAITLYVFSPLILWQIYFAQLFGSQNITTPIPKTAVVSPETVASLIVQAKNSIGMVDYTNAKNWFPTFTSKEKMRKGRPKVSSYTLSIPKINIKNAIVSTVDTDLGKHLINYEGTSILGDKGNTVIFGHSTLPQLYNPNDYKTIFANVYKLKIGDNIYGFVNSSAYLYRIYNTNVVDASDTSIFAQNYNNSYLTLVTCTPPGTTWKRLIIKAKLLEKI